MRIYINDNNYIIARIGKIKLLKTLLILLHVTFETSYNPTHSAWKRRAKIKAKRAAKGIETPSRQSKSEESLSHEARADRCCVGSFYTRNKKKKGGQKEWGKKKDRTIRFVEGPGESRCLLGVCRGSLGGGSAGLWTSPQGRNFSGASVSGISGGDRATRRHFVLVVPAPVYMYIASIAQKWPSPVLLRPPRARLFSSPSQRATSDVTLEVGSHYLSTRVYTYICIQMRR